MSEVKTMTLGMLRKTINQIGEGHDYKPVVLLIALDAKEGDILELRTDMAVGENCSLIAVNKIGNIGER